MLRCWQRPRGETEALFWCKSRELVTLTEWAKTIWVRKGRGEENSSVFIWSPLETAEEEQEECEDVLEKDFIFLFLYFWNLGGGCLFFCFFFRGAGQNVLGTSGISIIIIILLLFLLITWLHVTFYVLALWFCCYFSIFCVISTIEKYWKLNIVPFLRSGITRFFAKIQNSHTEHKHLYHSPTLTQ